MEDETKIEDVNYVVPEQFENDTGFSSEVVDDAEEKKEQECFAESMQPSSAENEHTQGSIDNAESVSDSGNDEEPIMSSGCNSTPMEYDNVNFEREGGPDGYQPEQVVESSADGSCQTDTKNNPEQSCDKTDQKGEQSSDSKVQPVEGVASVDYLARLDGKIAVIEENERKLFSEVREMHKLYHSEFAGRLRSMQEELDQYRKIDKGRIYDEILSALARIYVNNETLVDEVSEPKARKSIRYLLLDIEELLESFGMNKIRSNPGDKRNPRHCQVQNRIMTDDPNKHDTVAKSYNAGFYIDNRTVIKELVDVYIYQEQSLAIEEQENKPEEIIENPGQE